MIFLRITFVLTHNDFLGSSMFIQGAVFTQDEFLSSAVFI